MTTERGIVEAGRTKPWQTKAWVQLTAALLGVVPLYSLTIVAQIRGGMEISLWGFTFYLAVIAPISIVIVLLLLRLLCGERPGGLNLKGGRLPSDLAATLILSLVIVVANVASTGLLAGLSRGSASNTSVRALFAELAGRPGLLALFLGLLMPLGAASEEVVRAFLLSRLWKVWTSTPGKLAAVAVSAGLFGLVHIYQGPVRSLSAGILGLIMALYYLRFGRVVPLILAHYLTNAIQVVVFAANAR
jgi:membrane protease YdiL (CAAX protease family)